MHTTTTFQKSILTIAIALFSFYGLSQPGNKQQSKKDKIEQLKIAYITKELDLSVEDAEKFWPVYNDMNDALKTEKKSRRVKEKELKENFETLSEGEIEKKAVAILDSEIAEAKLKKEHTEKIAQIIGFKKAVKLLSIEQRFKKELLRKLNERQGPSQRQGQNQGQHRGQGQNRPNRSSGNRVNPR
jgi:formate dehydrogenase maturation protein FdhE